MPNPKSKGQLLKFLNSNLGILLLSAVIIGPAGYFFQDYRKSEQERLAEQKRNEQEKLAEQKRVEQERLAERRQNDDAVATYRRRVLGLCSEVFDRMNQFRDLNRLHRPSSLQLFELLTAKPGSTPPPLTIPAYRKEFEAMPMAPLVDELQSITSKDETLRPLASTIRRTYDATVAAYRSGARVAAIDAMQMQAQALISCREELGKLGF